MNQREILIPAGGEFLAEDVRDFSEISNPGLRTYLTNSDLLIPRRELPFSGSELVRIPFGKLLPDDEKDLMPYQLISVYYKLMNNNYVKSDQTASRKSMKVYDIERTRAVRAAVWVYLANGYDKALSKYVGAFIDDLTESIGNDPLKNQLKAGPQL